MVTTFIEFNDKLVPVQYSQNAPWEMAAILTLSSSQLQTQFSQKDL